MRSNFSPMLVGLALAAVAATGATAETLTSDWVQGHNSRARLIGGGSLAGVELQLPEGWKTYWRSPGEAGGVPPAFDWSKSGNLEKAEVLYPAPRLFVDKSGETIGYKDTVTFPVRFKAKDPSKPVDLHLSLDYGVCKDICIPAQAELALTVPPGDRDVGADLIEAMRRVPSPPDGRREFDPALKKTVAELSAAKPRVLLEVEFPENAERKDVFVEAPGGAYVPLPKKIADDGKGDVTYEIDLSQDVDIASLKGQPLTATMVSDQGQSEATFTLQ
jgi:DsbC/DsbD-like thiol-disulfide interchange protein